MDQIMHDARMVRLFFPDLVEDPGRLLLIGIGLVGLERAGVQGQAIESRSLAILGVALVDLRHRLLVRDRTGLMIELLIVAVEGGDRSYVIRLARRLGRGCNRLCDCLRTGFERSRRRGVPQRVPMTHGDPPIGHRAVGLGGGDRVELL